MARVLFSSGALHKQLGAHIGAKDVQLRVAGGRCSLWSDVATNDIPCEGRWSGTCTLSLETLLAALARIEDQPITLDLHDWAGARNILYACKVIRHEDRADEYQPIQFDL